MQIIIPFKTPTVNHLYFNWKGRMIITNEAKRLKKEIAEIVDSTPRDPIRDPPVKLKVTIEIHENWYTKKGEVKKKDIANREKFLIDSVFDALSIDDKMIFEHKMIKVQSEEEKAVINIEVLEE